MKRIWMAFFVVGLLFSACQGQKSGNNETEQSTDSIQAADTTTMTVQEEVASEETPMPKAADELFDDFIFNFAANRTLQASRIKFPLKIQRGEEVSVTAISGKWSQISYKGDVAYVLSKYISATKPDGDIIGKDATIVNCKVCVNVRAKASSHSTKLGTADLGTTWKVLGRSGNWIKVDYNGEPGFIYKKYVKIG